jgi:hypothetical protein
VEPTLLCGADLNGTTFTETYDELRKNQYHVIHFNGHPSVNLASPRNCGLVCGRCRPSAGDRNSVGCQTIALTGRDGGKLGPLAQLNIQVTAPQMGRIEDAHMIVTRMIGYYLMENDHPRA